MPREYGPTNAAPWASAPAVGPAGDTYFNTATKVQYVSDGTSWLAVGPGAGGPPTGTVPAGGDLTGSYPSPTLVTAQKNLWQTSGAGITPVDATDSLIVPGPTAAGADQATIIMGPSNRTTKGRVQAFTGIDWTGLSQNKKYNGSVWSRDDATKSAWTVSLADSIIFEYTSAAGVNSNPFFVQPDGKTYCTLSDRSVTSAMLAVGAGVAYGTGPSTDLLTANFSSATTGQWLAVGNSSTISHRGGTVIILVTIGAKVVQSTAAQSIYFGLFRNGTGGSQVYQIEFNLQSSSTGAGSWAPVPPIVCIDMPGAISCYYTFAIYQNVAFMLFASNGSQGKIHTVELS